uniref:Rab-GAP TBC domain-containing protein n=1 Tax=Bombyx mori TaxID=7091 RepID=A0A8R2QU43_BOMMO|nr:uncharacterized protein LOC101744825 isoform X2 [Bombyx mori]
MDQNSAKTPSLPNNGTEGIDFDLEQPLWCLEELQKAAIEHRLLRPRSLAWAIMLNALPPPNADIVSRLKCHRNFYDDLKVKLSMDPRAVIGDDPLSQNDKSAWRQHFCDNELKTVILQDVVRTFPDELYFREKDVQDLMVRVLFYWARSHSHVGYRQGMHEILAPLLFELYLDRKFAPRAISDKLKIILDEDYLEHDSYMLFNTVMQGLERFYVTGDVVPSPSGRMPSSRMIHPLAPAAVRARVPARAAGAAVGLPVRAGAGAAAAALRGGGRAARRARLPAGQRPGCGAVRPHAALARQRGARVRARAASVAPLGAPAPAAPAAAARRRQPPRGADEGEERDLEHRGGWQRGRELGLRVGGRGGGRRRIALPGRAGRAARAPAARRRRARRRPAAPAARRAAAPAPHPAPRGAAAVQESHPDRRGDGLGSRRRAAADRQHRAQAAGAGHRHRCQEQTQQTKLRSAEQSQGGATEGVPPSGMRPSRRPALPRPSEAEDRMTETGVCVVQLLDALRWRSYVNTNCSL